MSAVTEIIELRQGLALPLAVIVLGCALENRGYTFSRSGGRLMLNRPSGTPLGQKADNLDTLSDDDRSSIAKYKLHLLAVVDLMETTR